MDTSQLRKKVQNAVEMRKSQIIEIGNWIYNNPETGFREFKTSKYIAKCFNEMKLNCILLEDLPAVKVTFDTGKPGPGLAILGEMDSVICHEHPHCDKKTGAVHACGHNAQVAAMIGAAMGIMDSLVIEHLTGKLHFIAVPAEEYIEVEFRKTLRDQNKIRYLGGKPELLYRGFFDDVDLSMMVHAASRGNKKFTLSSTSNGCLVKRIKYIGKASHAGGSPDKGINALYAANLGLMAINSIRETFRENEYIRVHPIITKGGDVVNVIPCDVNLETFVRGKKIEDILKTNIKVNRALVGGAIAMGAQVEIEDIPGYFPFYSDEKFASVSRTVASELINDDEMDEYSHGTGSTDMGDLSTLMPVIQPYIGGCEGGLHSADFRITDPDTAYILGAKILACTAVELLANHASVAQSILRDYHPLFKNKAEYFEFADSLFVKRIYPEIDFFKELEYDKKL